MSIENLSAQLNAVVAALREDIKPELSSGHAKLRAELIDMLLSRLSAVAAGGDDGETYWPAVDAVFGRAASAADGAAVQLAEQLAHPAPENAQLIAAIAGFEARRRVRLEGAVAWSGRAVPAGHRSGSELSVSEEDISAYLKRRDPADPKIAVTNASVVPGGRSKATIKLNIVSKDGAGELIIRKDFELGVTGTSVAYEFPVVRAAFEAGLKVPEPFWLEEDETIIGGKFIVFARVPGKSMGTLFSADATPGFAKNFAAELAKLHMIDIDTNNLRDRLAFGAVENPVQALVETFYARYRRDLRPAAVMDAAFSWIRSEVSALGNEQALVHGDAGLHNTLGEGDTLHALLDWEFAHAGDPAEDLAYCKYLIERILPWESFMDAYIAAGGKAVSERRMRFFTIWRTLHLSIQTGSARELFDSGRDQDLRMAAIGYNTFPRQLKDLAVELDRYVRSSEGEK